MQVTNGNLTMRNSGAFASFANNVLTVDFVKLAASHDAMRSLTTSYNSQMQEAREAARSAQGEVTRCNNEIARLHERLDAQMLRLDVLEGIARSAPEKMGWVRRLFRG